MTGKEWSLGCGLHNMPRPAGPPPAGPPSTALLPLLCGFAVAISGCGSGGGATNPATNASATSSVPTAVAAPVISVQPVNQSVPMGLTATFSVTATGSSLQYQWRKNGAALLGATSLSYVTPPAAFADGGATYQVSVSNSGGTVTSEARSLTVSARAPLPGDLRFQQVDAPSTVNGWGNAGVGLSTDLNGRGGAYYSPSIGTPLYVGSAGNCGPPTMHNVGVSCAWFYSETPFAAAAGTALTMGYAADFYNDLQSDLQSPATWLGFGTGISAVAPGAVITSLDLEVANNLFALSWIQQTPQTSAEETSQARVQSEPQAGFVMEQNTVAPADLQAALTVEGASSRVVTAISNDGGQITYMAYGWLADTTTLYEVQAVTASTPGAPAAAAALAAQGYIITAIGRADSNGNILLIGTRVPGDTMPRPFVMAQGSTEIQSLEQQGYAIVGVIVNLNLPAEPYTWLGER
jgi:hypothetical protein